MKTFYLQREVKYPFDTSGRIFIDEKLHVDHEQLDTVEAETWVAAKAAFAAK
jgi:hypothetical protein